MKLIASILFPALLLAQQVQPSALIYRIIDYEPDGSDQMQSFKNVLSPLTVRVEPLLKIVTLVGTSKEQIDEGEAIIRKYSKHRPIPLQSPDRNVELTMYVLLGKPGGDPSSVPAILNPVIAQLR